MHIVHLSQVKRQHYRRVVACLLCTCTAAHIMIPDHEHWINLMSNLVWLFDPTHDDN
jgi:hypothetical protein